MEAEDKHRQKVLATGKGDVDMRFVTEVDRVLFGAYIIKPYDTQYFEMRWGNECPMHDLF